MENIMENSLFIKGILLGFSIAAPVGPIGVLCIRRTLSNGLLNGVLSGLGTATADALYGCIAAFSLTIVSTFLINSQIYLHSLGGLFLLYLGYKTFQSVPAEIAANVTGKGLFGSYTSALFLTLTNPMTIMSFAAVFAGLGIGTAGGEVASAVFVLGVFIGSMLWWLFLSGTVNLLRTRFNKKRLHWVNRFSGAVITAFGILSLSTI
jgi:threonine/homoserine/homoserine lactone efflux protein